MASAVGTQRRPLYAPVADARLSSSARALFYRR